MKAAVALILCAFVLSGCEREKRDFKKDPQAGSQEQIVQSTISPGDSGPVEVLSGFGKTYENNAVAQSEGKRLFSAYNCAGCHSHGGGGMGVPLIDDKWIYGSKIENIVQTIKEGRPNGMPSFRGKIPEEQIWQLAAYVRSMGGQVRQDVAPSRNDELNAKPAENREQSGKDSQ